MNKPPYWVTRELQDRAIRAAHRAYAARMAGDVVAYLRWTAAHHALNAKFMQIVAER